MIKLISVLLFTSLVLNAPSIVQAAQAKPAPAAAHQDCLAVKSEQMRLALLSSNIANVNTTRTPAGGPYQPYEKIACINGACQYKRGTQAPMMKYEPQHPDADVNGYVAYPNSNLQADQGAFDMAALKLKLLAQKGACGSKLVVDNKDSSFMIRYSSAKSDVQEDIFNLIQGRIVSWARNSSKGEATTLNLQR